MRGIPGQLGTPCPDLPSRQQSAAIAEWLAGPRSRALRRAAVGLRDCVLEAGCGHCVVTAELQRRARGDVVCLDITPEVLRASSAVNPVCGDCVSLPFTACSFDLVFFQNVLMWIPDLQAAIFEAARVLQAEGALVAIEPDYGGMMEHPDLGLRGIWIDALTRAGADPHMGRKLPAACEKARMAVWVELSHLPQQATAQAVSLLEDLPLTADQRRTTRIAANRIADGPGGWSQFLHVPYFLIVATKG